MGTNASARTGRPPRGSERGAALVLVLFLITTLTVLGVLVLNTSIVETKMANNQKLSSQAFYAAEAGLERALAKVMLDFEQDPSSANTGAKPWGNNAFAGADTVRVTVRASGTPAWSSSQRTLDMWLNSPGVKAWSFTPAGGRGGTTLGRAGYRIYSWSPSANEIYFLSYATQPDAVAAVEYHLLVNNLSPFMNAIFMGTGLSGSVQGNVSVHGSVYTNGSLNFGGTVDITNNYSDGSALGSLAFSVPNGDDLQAKIRIKGGDLNLSGNAKVGASGGAGPPKHSMAGVYVDGAIPGSGVYADETSHSVPNIPMPDILDGLKAQYGDTFIATNFPGASSTISARLAYSALAAGTGPFAATPPAKGSTGVVINRPLTFPMAAATWQSVDALGNGIFWTKTPAAGQPNLKVVGNVVIKGALSITGITYTCKGPFTSDSMGNAVTPANQNEQGAMLYCTGNVSMSSMFAPPTGSGYLMGGANTNSIGIATPGTVTMGGHNGDYFTGMIYAQTQVSLSKQMKFLGTIICGTGSFSNVPDIYQVPALANYLPRFMPGAQNVLQFSNRDWRRVY